MLTQVAAVAGIQSLYMVGYSVLIGLPQFIFTLGASAAWDKMKSLYSDGYSDWLLKQQQINYKKLGAVVDTWSTTHALWAVRGKRDDGSDYSLSRWFMEGYSLGQQIVNQAEDVPASSLAILGDLKQAAGATYHDVTTPSAWPWWLKAGVGIGALYALSQIVGNLSSAIPRSRSVAGFGGLRKKRFTR